MQHNQRIGPSEQHETHSKEWQSVLVALHDIRPGNGVGLLFQPRSSHGARPRSLQVASVHSMLYSEAIVVDITATGTQGMF